MKNEDENGKKDGIMILRVPNEINFIKSMPSSLRQTKIQSKEEIRNIKVEMAYAKENYLMRLSYLKDRIQTEKNKVILQKEKMKNPKEAYQKYIKQTNEMMGDSYHIIVDDSVWSEYE